MTAASFLDPQGFIDTDEQWSTHNYHPLPVVISSGDGAWVTDVSGRHYLDFLAGYSALNFGHRHPALVAAATEQLVLPMNTGAEAVESAIKVARLWAHRVKGVPDGSAEIVVASGNFHGRTTTIVSFSTDEIARTGFGPFTPGFVVVPYGDLDALRDAMTPRTAAVLVEPIQGEAGVLVPPPGYLAGVRATCDDAGALLIADEIQSGLARSGELLALDHEGVRADLDTLGKALGGGILPVSAVVGQRAVLGVLRPGEHGSTFGGNPLACAVGRAVVALLASGEFQSRSRELGAHLHTRLQVLLDHGAAQVTGRGLWAGLHIAPGGPPARTVAETLMGRGVLCKEAHEMTLRIAPPLIITHSDLDIGLDAIIDVLTR